MPYVHTTHCSQSIWASIPAVASARSVQVLYLRDSMGISLLHRIGRGTQFSISVFSLNYCLWKTVEEGDVWFSFHKASGIQRVAVCSSLDALTNIHNQYTYTHQWELWIPNSIASTCNSLFVKLFLFTLVCLCCLNVLSSVGFIFM